LSNECLQQHFNNYVFKSELADYSKEGVEIDEITFADNQDILELIQGKGGIFSILDNEVSVPKATNKTFVAKLNKEFGSRSASDKTQKNKRYREDKFADGAITFTLEHFAGEVIYDCEGWLEKNVDQPPIEAIELMQSSTNSVLAAIGADLAEDAGAGSGAGSSSGPGGRNAKKKTVASQFKESLSVLMMNINDSDPHFIRCIKPNMAKEARRFDPVMSYEQLVYSGAMEAVKIRQAGYPMRMLVKEFFSR
jgi:myosin heavy subunit